MFMVNIACYQSSIGDLMLSARLAPGDRRDRVTAGEKLGFFGRVWISRAVCFGVAWPNSSKDNECDTATR